MGANASVGSKRTGDTGCCDEVGVKTFILGDDTRPIGKGKDAGWEGLMGENADTGVATLQRSGVLEDSDAMTGDDKVLMAASVCGAQLVTLPRKSSGMGWAH